MTNKVYDAETLKSLREALEDQQISNDLHWAFENHRPIEEKTLRYILKLFEAALPTRNDAGLVDALANLAKQARGMMEMLDDMPEQRMRPVAWPNAVEYAEKLVSEALSNNGKDWGFGKGDCSDCVDGYCTMNCSPRSALSHTNSKEG